MGHKRFDSLSRTSPINSVWLMVPLLSQSAAMKTLSMALSLRFPSFFLSALCSFFAACKGNRRQCHSQREFLKGKLISLEA